ncbi:MAG: type II secretion system minor pseudopilin GspI [Immundisolibacteraceae bacterium]|nr:type II secretion system minor pseudopilin GspI [Immundisolibacteraceae bacterium]
MRPIQTRNFRGFTLIEVLIALLIVALAMTAGYRAIASGSNNQRHLEQRTLAGWVAENEMVKLQLGTVQPHIGITTGQQMMGGRNWLWQRVISVAADTALRRVSLSVTAEGNDGPSATLVAFVAAGKKS